MSQIIGFTDTNMSIQGNCTAQEFCNCNSQDQTSHDRIARKLKILLANCLPYENYIFVTFKLK